MIKIVLFIMLLVMTSMASVQEGVKVYTNYSEFSKLETPKISVGDFIVYDGSGEFLTVFSPPTSITFGDNVGRISWETGELVFTGNIDESAKIFFEYVWEQYCRRN